MLSNFFREILMTASANIKTPSMDLPLKPGPKAKKRAKQLQRKFTKVTLAQVPPTLMFYFCSDLYGKRKQPHEKRLRCSFHMRNILFYQLN